MKKRRLMLVLIAIAITFIVALVEVNATEYMVLNQGDRPACIIYADATDFMIYQSSERLIG